MSPGGGWAATRRQRGFTLIELMVVVIIVGIMASIAVPAYNTYMREARRSDARSALNQIAAQQAEYVLNHAAYATTVTALGLGSTSENGYYALSLPVANTASFTARATATAEQSNDNRCATFEITHTGTKTAKTSSSANSTDDCW